MLREELRHNAVRIRKLESELAKRFDEVLRSPYLDSNEIVRRSSVYQCPSRQIVKFERLDRYLDRLKKKSPSFHQHPFPTITDGGPTLPNRLPRLKASVSSFSCGVFT